MTALPISQKVRPRGTWQRAVATCALTYDARFFRRKKLITDAGWAFVADFEKAVSLNDGDGLELPGSRIVAIAAAPESLLAITGPDLTRLAWHIGNRHTPCQIEPARLLILEDPVIAAMLMKLGAQVVPVTQPFNPEGGAYGLGRTHGHAH
ncbi:MAG: urease accessory protein UreE [Pseudomonadota bacterium]